MEPTSDRSDTLVDLIDRILMRGIILHADLVIARPLLDADGRGE